MKKTWSHTGIDLVFVEPTCRPNEPINLSTKPRGISPGRFQALYHCGYTCHARGPHVCNKPVSYSNDCVTIESYAILASLLCSRHNDDTHTAIRQRLHSTATLQTYDKQQESHMSGDLQVDFLSLKIYSAR